jgi:hypothetical protein
MEAPSAYAAYGEALKPRTRFRSILNGREVSRHASPQRDHLGVASDLRLPLIVIRVGPLA